MNDIFDSLSLDFVKNKKIIFIILVIYILVILGVIVSIWWPDKKDYLEYKSVNIEEKQHELATEYIDRISMLFRTEDKDAVKSLISYDYTSYIGKTSDKIIEELDNSGFFSLYSEVRGVDLYVDGNTYVFTTTIYSGGKEKNINIIETAPYQYRIAFDDFYKFSKSNKVTNSQGIKFKVKEVYNNLKYIEMNINIENQNKSYARFDFNAPNCIQAVLSDGKTYSISNHVSTSQYVDVEPNTIITKNVIFQIPAQLQSGIEYIVFNGVTLEFSNVSIKVAI